MQPAEVVVSDAERDGRTVIFKFAAESIRQPSHAPDRHPEGQIEALDMRSGDAIRIRIPANRNAVSASKFGRGVAPLEFNRSRVGLY
jgi:hypothetical protein